MNLALCLFYGPDYYWSDTNYVKKNHVGRGHLRDLKTFVNFYCVFFLRANYPK